MPATAARPKQAKTREYPPAVRRLAKQFITESATADEFGRWGELYSEVSHVTLGGKLRDFRRSKGVDSVLMLRRMKVPFPKFSLLEKGALRWDKAKVLEYVDAVMELAE